MREIGIEDIIPYLLSPGWVAMDKDEQWYVYYGEKAPTVIQQAGKWFSYGSCYYIPGIPYNFKIKPAEDWKKSLRRVD